MNKIIIFGCGYVGKYLTEILKNNFHVIPTHREQNVIFNPSTPLDKDLFDNTTHLLISIPPIDNEDLVLKQHRQDIKKINHLKWIGYLSSTGVYGDHQGKWVDEESMLLADDNANLNRINAEKLWKREFPGQTHIFRLAGIYGPSRSPIDKIKNGTARRINKPGNCFSRIHVEDICAILKKSMEQPTPAEIFNLADDLPEEPSKVMEYFCDQANLDYPPLEELEDIAEGQLKNFYKHNKKVLNLKVKKMLNYQFLHPNYKV